MSCRACPKTGLCWSVLLGAQPGVGRRPGSAAPAKQPASQPSRYPLPLPHGPGPAASSTQTAAKRGRHAAARSRSHDKLHAMRGGLAEDTTARGPGPMLPVREQETAGCAPYATTHADSRSRSSLWPVHQREDTPPPTADGRPGAEAAPHTTAESTASSPEPGRGGGSTCTPCPPPGSTGGSSTC